MPNRLITPPLRIFDEDPPLMMSEEARLGKSETFHANAGGSPAMKREQNRFSLERTHEIVRAMKSLNSPDSDWIQAVRGSPLFRELRAGRGIRIELRYATVDNFTGEVLYVGGAPCFLHQAAATKLERAAEVLTTLKTGWSLLVLDALRPRRVQRRMWSFVEGTPQEPYVASPERGSIHGFGYAVDLTLADEAGREVEMGTAFDEFSELSQPCLEEKFLAAGLLSPEHLANRELLRKVMSEAGFTGIPNEWWHFEAKRAEEVRREDVMVE